MIPIYIGWDKTETVAYHVLCHSIIRRSSVPVSITPLNRQNLKGIFDRPRGELDSTDFSNSRFIVPHLQDYKGWAIFMDCDMLCLGDIADLWAERDNQFAVMVRKHTHIPTEETKFLGAVQTKYSKKNWSSLMLMNCAYGPTKADVNTKHGLWLHQFQWCPPEYVGDLSRGWNYLVDVDDPVPAAQLLHYTKGGPWHHVHGSCDSVWYAEYEHMMEGENPSIGGEQAMRRRSIVKERTEHERNNRLIEEGVCPRCEQHVARRHIKRHVRECTGKRDSSGIVV